MGRRIQRHSTHHKTLVKALKSPERAEQKALVKMLNNHGIYHYHIPNGQKRDLRSAVELKRQGLVRGVPDLCLPISSHNPNFICSGIYIEVKEKTRGKMSKEQKVWQKILEHEKYAFICGESLDWIQIWDKILGYLKLMHRWENNKFSGGFCVKEELEQKSFQRKCSHRSQSRQASKTSSSNSILRERTSSKKEKENIGHL